MRVQCSTKSNNIRSKYSLDLYSFRFNFYLNPKILDLYLYMFELNAYIIG